MTKEKARRRASTWIGTSGWHYDDWWGAFYPQDISKKKALDYYSTRFATTELNAPFYRMPTEKGIRHWFETVPDDFRFAWKASRFITHRKRLLVDDRSLEMLESGLNLLGHKLGPVLFQLPPNMKVDRERLATFLVRLKRTRRYCFEFRHPSWYVSAIFDLLRDHDIALCLSDHADAPAPREVTATWIYIRNHGPGGRYRGNYPDRDLQDWAASIKRWTSEGHDVWCFFDNDVKSAAPSDAGKLMSHIEQTV